MNNHSLTQKQSKNLQTFLFQFSNLVAIEKYFLSDDRFKMTDK